MTAPIFILGCHRSGTSVVAGLLVKACGLSMGELMPPTEDNPKGYFEALAVVDAHRDLLAQMERDWTCPPSSFRPEALDLSALREQAAIHQELPGVWGMKDPRSMFLLPAWSEVGVDRVRLVAVARPPAATIRSLVKRDGLGEDQADAIVEAHLGRLVEIADQLPLPVVEFPGDDMTMVDQVRDLAEALGLPWDEDAARDFFTPELIRNELLLKDPSPTYEALLQKAQTPAPVPEVELSALHLTTGPEQALATHLGIRHAKQRSELWEIADFSSFPDPEVVELLRCGGRPGRGRRPGMRLHRLEVSDADAVGAALLDGAARPHGVVAHQLLAGLADGDVDYFFRSVYTGTHPVARLVVDVPDPEGAALRSVEPAYPEGPRPSRVRDIASESGWDFVESTRVSAGRTGMVFRKRVSVDTELVPVVADLLTRAPSLRALDERVSALERGAGSSHGSPADAGGAAADNGSLVKAERKRADDAVHELELLRRRKSVRLALALSRLFEPLFRVLRTWKR